MNFDCLKVLLVSAALFSGGLVSSAQMNASAPESIRGARMPALSPDGKRLAFVYKGDIWVASTAGGRSTALTAHLEYDAYPVFSPDGKWLAFASKRSGNWDIFIMPADGGVPRQITWHSGSDLPGGWSPDGKKLLVAAKRDTPDYLLLAVDVNTLKTERLTEDYAPINNPAYSPNGDKIVYGRYGFPNWRPRYTGSAAAQIWLLDRANCQRQAITHDDRQHLWTQFMPDGKRLLTVTIGEPTPSAAKLNEVTPRIQDSPTRTPNLWLIELDGQARQLTEFCGGAVRSPSVATKSGDIAFEYEQDLYVMKSAKGKPAKLKLIAEADEKQTSRRYEKLVTGAGEAEPSPDGKLIAFGLRGDLWTVLVEKPKGVAGRDTEFARRLTEWAGDDSDFMWSKDGKTLYFTSDRAFNTRLYALELASLKVQPLWNRPEDVSHPTPSPDGKQLAYWVAGPEGGLFVMDLATKTATNVVKLPGPHLHGYGGSSFAWSPDSQWLAYAARSASRAQNIFIVKAAGGEPVNVTRLVAAHNLPAWSPDGKSLYFQSNRAGDGLYILPLKPEDALATETDLKYEKPKGEVKVEIDFTDITQRIRKFAGQSPQADLTVTPEGLIVFLSEGDVWSVTYDGKESKRITTGGGKGQLRVLADGKRSFFTQGGELYQMKLAEGKAEKVAFAADWERDVRAERQAAFAQFWRTYNRAFYDGHFHGRDWEGLRKKYEPLLDSIETSDEFAGVLQLMVGELEASHSEVTPSDPAVKVTTPHLGVTFDYSHAGPGLKVATVPPGAPGSFKQTEIKPGEFILEINGQPVALDESLYQFLNPKAGRELEFLVNSKPEKAGARKVRYKVLTPDEWSDLNYKNRIQRARKLVESQSDGKIGYVHISAMGGENQNRFEQEVYEYIAGKAAMIIDVRFNRGGNISDTLIDWLERKQHGWFRGRDSEADPSPARAWDKPVIVLLNEHSYSNGEMFPYAMRQRGLARLVGMPTPGYVIWTWNFNLIDGTKARLPLAGVYRLDGSNQEDNGEKPDVIVPLTPEDWLAERDPQLDKAIELLRQKN